MSLHRVPCKSQLQEFRRLWPERPASDSDSPTSHLSAGAVDDTHQVVLGLQLDLQGIDCASQLDDLCLAGLQLL